MPQPLSGSNMKMPFHIGKSPAKKKGTTNNSGAILALVVIVLVIVNTLGVGLLSQSAMNAIEVVRKVQSNQAFWVAEGGLEVAISYFPDVPETNSLSGPLGEGGYNVTITPISAYRWTIESEGIVNIATRRIRVEIGPDATIVMTVSGDLTVGGTASVDGDVERHTTPSFEGFFGVTKEEMQNNATYEYTNPSNNQTPVEQITWVNEDDKFKITEEGWEGSGIMVVDGDLEIQGGTFDGVIWVVGSLDISGNTVINGAIFVEGSATVGITGTAEISFDHSAISDAFSDLGTLPELPEPVVLSWQEF